jgi:dCMP deaminase
MTLKASEEIHPRLRPSWDSVWMTMARTIAERSIDPRLQCGAVIVTSDNSQMLSCGYNGNYRGGPNVVDSLEPGQSNCIHAEENALIKLDFNNPKKKIMYVTHNPCVMCAKKIINACIDEVVYEKDYRIKEGIEIMKSAGLIVRQLNIFETNDETA